MGKTLEEIASLVGGRVVGKGGSIVNGIAPLEEAGPTDIVCVTDRKNLKKLSSTKAGAVILSEGDFKDISPGGENFILVKNAQLAFAKALEVLRPQEPPPRGVHPKSEIGKDAWLGKDISIGPFVVVENGARIGDRVTLRAGVYIGNGASVGDDSILYPGVSVRERCVIGSRVIIHSNSVVGSDGFGYAKDGPRYYKIPQTGIVRIEDDCEVGACVTIDRATIGETAVGRGTKIDNLVQIAHNVKIGPDSIIVAQAGIAGSAIIGARVQLGGQAGITGHITVGDDSSVAAKAGVIGDVPPKSVVSGFPAVPRGEWLRAQSLVLKLPELKKMAEELEKRIKELEDKAKG